MRLIWINSIVCIAAIIAGASFIMGGGGETVRLIAALLVVALGIYRLSDVVRSE